MKSEECRPSRVAIYREHIPIIYIIVDDNRNIDCSRTKRTFCELLRIRFTRRGLSSCILTTISTHSGDEITAPDKHHFAEIRVSRVNLPDVYIAD